MAKEGKKETKLQRVEPAHVMTPFEEMDRFFNSFFPQGFRHPFRWGGPLWSEMMPVLEAQAPKVDVIDRDEEIIIRAEVPGVEKENLDVSVSDNAVTIKGETKREEKEEKGNYYRSEISRGAFSRTVALPGYVNAEGAKAKFTDGVLELTLPKTEKVKRRSVKIE